MEQHSCLATKQAPPHAQMWMNSCKTTERQLFQKGNKKTKTSSVEKVKCFASLIFLSMMCSILLVRLRFSRWPLWDSFSGKGNLYISSHIYVYGTSETIWRHLRFCVIITFVSILLWHHERWTSSKGKLVLCVVRRKRRSWRWKAIRPSNLSNEFLRWLYLSTSPNTGIFPFSNHTKKNVCTSSKSRHITVKSQYRYALCKIFLLMYIFR